jgi:SAM-dependent methyltransferase
MGAPGRYNQYRLPIIRALLGLAYRLETISVQRVWHVRRALRAILAARDRQFSLVDMGCGLGDEIFALAGAWPAGRFTGIDHVAENILMCRAYQALRGLGNVTFEEADIRAPRPPASADIALLATVLQYLDDPIVPLQNARSMLAPGGVLVVFQDVYAAPHSSGRSLRDHDREYTPAEIIDAIERAGFHIERSEYCQGRLAARAEHALRWLLHGVKHGTTSAALAALLLVPLIPAYLVIQWSDFVRPHDSGAGLLIVARPQPEVRLR